MRRKCSMKTETFDISLSLDQPDAVLDTLLKMLQQIHGQYKVAASGKMPDYRNLLIIDADEERAQYFAHLLARAGYRPIVMANAFKAFSRFLQVPYVPFAVIVGHEDPSNRLFLQRLLQQLMQKYSWASPLIRLHFQGVRPSPEVPQLQQGPHSGSLPSKAMMMPPPSSGRLQQSAFTPPPSSGYPTHSAPLTPASGLRFPTPGYPSPFDDESGEPAKRKVMSLEGQSLGRYSIISVLGDEGSSNTYKTYDRLRERDIALKAFQTDSIPYYIIERTMEEGNYFQWEVDLLEQMKHVHLSPIWNTGKSYISGTPFIYKTLPFYEEGSLANWITRNGGGNKMFTPRDVGHVLLQIADVLQYLHDRQLTFQNFKLANLMVRNVTKELGQIELVLSDFAIPQDGSFFSRTSEAYPYMAPERWYGQASPASDQYALAVLIYELLAGRHPFQGSAERTMKLLHTNMPVQPPSTFNPYLPPVLNNVLLRALAKTPGERFASVALFARTYQQYCM